MFWRYILIFSVYSVLWQSCMWIWSLPMSLLNLNVRKKQNKLNLTKRGVSFTCDLRIRMSADTLSCSSDSRFLSMAGRKILIYDSALSQHHSTLFDSLATFRIHQTSALCVAVLVRLTLKFVSCIVCHLLDVIGNCLKVILCFWEGRDM